MPTTRQSTRRTAPIRCTPCYSITTPSHLRTIFESPTFLDLRADYYRLVCEYTGHFRDACINLEDNNITVWYEVVPAVHIFSTATQAEKSRILATVKTSTEEIFVIYFLQTSSTTISLRDLLGCFLQFRWMHCWVRRKRCLNPLCKRSFGRHLLLVLLSKCR